MELTAGDTLGQFHKSTVLLSSRSHHSAALIVMLCVLLLWHAPTFNLFCQSDGCMQRCFSLPPGIIRDRALVETDFGTFGTAPVFPAGLLFCTGFVWPSWSAEAWLVASGLSIPSPLGVSWSRCSEKLPNKCKCSTQSESQKQVTKWCQQNESLNSLKYSLH